MQSSSNIYLYIQNIFTECLRYARHHPGCLEHTRGGTKVPRTKPLNQGMFLWELVRTHLIEPPGAL